MIGSTINQRYKIDSEIGKGGMGVVYKAFDNTLKREVAIKVMANADIGTDGRARLLNEAQMVAKLDHPNIVTVFDAGEYEEQPYIVMQLIEGQTLDNARPETIAGSIKVAKDICAALQHAHDNEIIHRDLKPENVIINPDGSAKLMDFGLARSIASRLTSEGTIVGTVFYMAPEQALGEEVDARTDLYALGVLLYELVTGELPYNDENAVAVISQHIHAPLVPPKAKRDDLPSMLNKLIVHLLEKAPDDRPPSASDVISALDDPNLLDTSTSADEELSVLDRIVRGRMVGRQEEYKEARSLWNQVIAGKGQTLLISGEPGIGKTRLMREMVTQAEVSGGEAFVGEAYAESNAPYGAFAQIARAALSRISGNGISIPEAVLADMLTLAPDVAHLFPDIPPNPKLDPESEQQRLLEHMVAFCEALAEEAPLLLVVDDAHWGDGNTLTMLQHLIRRTQDKQVMMLATYREVELREARPFNDMLLELNRQRLGTRIKLNRLTKDQARDMLTAIFADEITDDFLEAVYRETDGNPFFMEEICRALVESGELYFEGGEWHRPDMEELEIPQGVQVAVESRLSKLPEDVQDAMRMAAILGREFEFEILMQALDMEEDTLIDAMERAEESQMIQEVEERKNVTFAFVHALVPQAIRESIRTLRRRKLYKQAAAAFEAAQPENYESLAYHYANGGADAKALLNYTLAGQRALDAFANQDAEQYLLSALDLVEDEKEEAHLQAKLGIAQDLMSKHDTAFETWKAAIETYLKLNLDSEAARLYARCGRNRWNSGDTPGALSICLKGLEKLKNAPESAGIAHLLSETARSYIFNGQTEEGLENNQKALDMSETFDVPGVQAESLNNMASFGDMPHDEAIAALEQAIAVAHSANLFPQEARAHFNLGVRFNMLKADPRAAMEQSQIAARIGRRAGAVYGEAFALSSIAGFHLSFGEFESLNADIERLEQLKQASADPTEIGLAIESLEANHLAIQGQLREAIEINRRHQTHYRKIEELQSLAGASFRLTFNLIENGDYREVIEAVEEVVSIGKRMPIFGRAVPYSLLSRANTGLGDLKQARDYLNKAYESYIEQRERHIDLYFLKQAEARLLAKEESWEEAWAAFKSSAEMAVKREDHFVHAQILRDWGSSHMERGQEEDKERAKELWEQAIEEFKIMQSEHYVQAMEKLIADLG